MSKAERIEDLGKLYILLNELTEDDLFMKYETPKYACDIFFANCEDKKYQDIREIAYGLERINDRVIEMLNIARGDME